MIYHLFANRANIGDWLAARAVRRLAGLGPVVECYCDEPFVPATLACLGTATATDFILIGGGGLFTKYFEPLWEGFEDIAQRVPFAIWGVGCCDMKRQDTQPCWPRLASIAAASRLCAVRDTLTRNRLGASAVSAPAICPSIAEVRWRPRGWGILHVDSLDVVGDEVYWQTDASVKRFAADSNRPLRTTNNIIQAGEEPLLAATLDLYVRSDIIVSSRLHGCVIGLAMGRPVIAIAGDRKVDAFMQEAGLSDWVLDLTDIDRLPARLREVSDQPSARAFLARGLRQNREIGAGVRRLLQEIVAVA